MALGGILEILLGIGKSQGSLSFLGGSHTVWPLYIIRRVVGNDLKVSQGQLGIRKGFL